MNWYRIRPIAFLNVAFILLISVLFLYQLLRPIDVLQDWHMELAPVKEYKLVEGRRLAVYHPNESLIFTSTSKKVASTTGVTSRTLECEATELLGPRVILLDTSPASRPAGPTPERATSIILPDVVQFNKLPRVCRLVINITYSNVALWRNFSEHAETEPFLVEEVTLTPVELKKKIAELNELTLKLEAQIAEMEKKREGQ